MLKLTVAVLFCTFCVSFGYLGVTPEVYNDLELQVMKMLKSLNGSDPHTGVFKYSVLGSVVRAGFHTCVGTCNGCINLNDGNNYGIGTAVSPLEAVYKLYSKYMSRADFWAFSTTIANKFAAGTVGGSMYIPKFRPEYGRTDCPTSPGTSEMYHYPSAFYDCQGMVNYYWTTMRLTAQETVALMGGHTLGGGHRKNSGFHNDWDDQPNKLDNGFYQDLLDKTFGWKMDDSGSNAYPNHQYQWVHSDGSFFMLDADMGLYKDITPVATNGNVKCTYSTCKLAATHMYVEAYAANNTLWLDEYAAVYTKMLSTGFRGKLTPVFSSDDQETNLLSHTL